MWIYEMIPESFEWYPWIMETRLGGKQGITAEINLLDDYIWEKVARRGQVTRYQTKQGQ